MKAPRPTLLVALVCLASALACGGPREGGIYDLREDSQDNPDSMLQVKGVQTAPFGELGSSSIEFHITNADSVPHTFGHWSAGIFNRIEDDDTWRLDGFEPQAARRAYHPYSMRRANEDGDVMDLLYKDVVSEKGYLWEKQLQPGETFVLTMKLTHMQERFLKEEGTIFEKESFRSEFCFDYDVLLDEATWDAKSDHLCQFLRLNNIEMAP